MRIEREDGAHVGDVWAVVEEDEAFELMEALIFHFVDAEALSIANQIRQARQPIDDPGWHAHVGRPDTLTLAIQPADS